MAETILQGTRADFEREMQAARDRNEALRASIIDGAHDWMQGQALARNRDITLEKARRAEGRARYLDSYLAALKAGKPLPVAPRSIFGADELKYMSAHGCPVEFTP